jgi:polyketide cyclase/dehydrase/lipid transport protein
MHRLDHDEVSAVLPADPPTVFRLISDVTRTPEWSPQVVSCEWLDGATEAAIGARFTARNGLGRFTWANTPVITRLDPDRTFAFSRTERGGGTMEWFYRLEPHENGSLVTLGYNVLQPVPKALHIILRLLLGVRDLRADLHENMVLSLNRITEIVADHPEHARS